MPRKWQCHRRYREKIYLFQHETATNIKTGPQFLMKQLVDWEIMIKKDSRH